MKSVHFTDSLLAKIYKQVKQQQDKSSYILYLSDHADEVSDNVEDGACFCHFDARNSRKAIEIPFVLWMSEKYKKENAVFAEKISGYLNRPYESSRAIYSILDLSRLYSQDTDVTKSIFNEKFQLRKRRYDSINSAL